MSLAQVFHWGSDMVNLHGCFTVLLLLSTLTLADNKDSKDAKETKKPMMKFLGAFDAGLPNVSIIKLLDPTDEVLCYVLMPDHTSRRQVDKEKWVYEANSVGSISCLKVRMPVIPVAPNGTIQNNYQN